MSIALKWLLSLDNEAVVGLSCWAKPSGRNLTAVPEAVNRSFSTDIRGCGYLSRKFESASVCLPTR